MLKGHNLGIGMEIALWKKVTNVYFCLCFQISFKYIILGKSFYQSVSTNGLRKYGLK